MRLSYGSRRLSRLGRRHGTLFLLLTAVMPLTANAVDIVPAPPANIDFSLLGSAGIAGDFSGISLYQFIGQDGGSNKNGSAALFSSLPNDSFSLSAQTDATIRALCLYKAPSNTSNLIIGGNFTSLGGSQSKAIGLWDLDARKVVTFQDLEGEVNALFCDPDQDIVYIGGNFKSGNSTNAIAWNLSAGFTALPFAGFNGPVNTITKLPNGNILFGGSFTGLGNLNTSAPGRHTQIVNLGSAEITSQGSSTKEGFGDPAKIVCSSGSDKHGDTWLLQDQTKGYWDAQFGFTFQPSKIRIWNTHIEGHGTKTFNILTFPNGLTNIMNMTYVVPETGKTAACDRVCPLSNDPKVPYQDFHFVNPVGMNRFRVDISDWWGSGAGLAGLQVFSNNILAYAVQDFNEPACRAENSRQLSSAAESGPWKQMPAGPSRSAYLSAKLERNGSPANASVIFYPSITQAGNYSINLYTPGCIADGTCVNRGRVHVSGTMTRNSPKPDFDIQLYQTNDFDKYDQIYFGFADRTSDSFKPSITLHPTAEQTVEDLVVVAQQVGVTLINSAGGLNGLFEFDPKKTVINETSLIRSPFNQLGYSFDKMSGVEAFATIGDTTYIAGNFTSKAHNNIVAVSTKAEQARNLDGGLNGQVSSLLALDRMLYAAGTFTNTLSNDTDGLHSVAVYDPDSNTWTALGAGLDGPAQFVVPLSVNTTEGKPETVVAFSGTFTKSLGHGNASSAELAGIAIWVPSQKIWLHDSPNNVPSYSGTLTATYLGSDGLNSFLAGDIQVSTLAVGGAAKLTQFGLGRFPAEIHPKALSPSNERSSTFRGTNVTGVVTGFFHDTTKHEYTILAGHFVAKGFGNTSLIHNLVLIDGKHENATSGLGEGISDNSTFFTVDTWNNILFAGGQVTGTVNGNDVGGIIGWDMDAGVFANHPAALSGGNGAVQVIAVRPSHNEVFVGGSFEKAGALDCPGLCVYNINNDQWTRPGTAVSGTVSALEWINEKTALVAGNLEINSTRTRPMAFYNIEKQTWTDFPGADTLPGPIDVMTPASADRKQIWVGGKSATDKSVFLMKYDGRSWQKVVPELPKNTILRSIQVFSLTKNHGSSPLLAKDEVLMLTGVIELPDIGPTSACLFNGTHYQAYALTNSNGDDPGSISQIFTQRRNHFGQKKRMPLVFVVLIGLAISLALILAVVVAGVVLDRMRKKREGYVRAPTSMQDRGSGIQRIPPRELLESLGRVGPGGSPAI